MSGVEIAACRCGCGPNDDPHAVQVQTYRDFDRDGPEDCYVLCEACGAEGPYSLSRAKAIVEWNRREV